MSQIEKYTQQLEVAYINAKKLSSKISEEVINIEGYSGRCTLHFFNNLMDSDDIRFLEIGVYRGSITSAVLCGNNVDIVCIDNFSENCCKEIFLENLRRFTGNNSVNFIESNWENVNDISKRNIYYYDANYPLIEHRNAFKHFLPFMDNIFIFIASDYNWQDTRKNIQKMIDDNCLKILFEKNVHSKKNELISQGHNENCQNFFDQVFHNGICNGCGGDRGKYDSKEHYTSMKEKWYYGIYFAVLEK
jgi:hypothetical protein